MLSHPNRNRTCIASFSRKLGKKRKKNLRAEFIKHARVGLHQPEQVLRFKQSQRSEVRSGLGEAFEFVRTRISRVQKYWLRMP